MKEGGEGRHDLLSSHDCKKYILVTRYRFNFLPWKKCVLTLGHMNYPYMYMYLDLSTESQSLFSSLYLIT
jgi:hypothetical protein